MAKYLATQSGYINGQYFEGSVARPVIVEFPDDVAPSRTFEPLDAAAQAALKKLDVDKKLNTEWAEVPPPPPHGDPVAALAALNAGSGPTKSPISGSQTEAQSARYATQDSAQGAHGAQTRAAPTSQPTSHDEDSKSGKKRLNDKSPV